LPKNIIKFIFLAQHLTNL